VDYASRKRALIIITRLSAIKVMRDDLAAVKALSEEMKANRARFKGVNDLSDWPRNRLLPLTFPKDAPIS